MPRILRLRLRSCLPFFTMNEKSNFRNAHTPPPTLPGGSQGWVPSDFRTSCSPGSYNASPKQLLSKGSLRVSRSVDSLVALVRPYVSRRQEWRNRSIVVTKPVSWGSMQAFLWFVITFAVAAALIFVFYGVLNGSNLYTKTYSDQSPVLPISQQYALVIDAGSSGSRIYVYSWPRVHMDSSLPSIEPVVDDRGNPYTKKKAPGLSSFAVQSSEDILDYISELLDFAEGIIPKESHPETPLFILATAGMRLLKDDEQEKILNSLIKGIPKKYDFGFTEKSIEIITGMQEGVFQWLAINYVLGNFNHNATQLKERPSTVGILDMGGASMQIALEVDEKVRTVHPGAEILRVQLSGRKKGKDESKVALTYSVYVTTFLGFGANEKLIHHQEDMVARAVNASPTSPLGLSAARPIRDPCLPLNLVDEVHLIPNDFMSRSRKRTNGTEVASPFKKGKRTFFFRGTGDWLKCRVFLTPLTKKPRRPDSKCDSDSSDDEESSSVQPGCDPWPPLYSPPVDWSTAEFYAFSEFWYSTHDVLNIGGPYNRDSIRERATAFCGSDWSVLDGRFKERLYPGADHHRLKYQCFKSAWIVTALHDGMKFPPSFSRLTSSPNEVNGQIVAWTLGAMLQRSIQALPHGTRAHVPSSSFPELESSKYPSVLTGRGIYPGTLLFAVCIFVIFAITGSLVCRLWPRSQSYKLVPCNGIEEDLLPLPISMRR